MIDAQETSGHQPGEELCNCDFSLAYGERGPPCRRLSIEYRVYGEVAWSVLFSFLGPDEALVGYA